MSIWPIQMEIGLRGMFTPGVGPIAFDSAQRRPAMPAQCPKADVTARDGAFDFQSSPKIPNGASWTALTIQRPNRYSGRLRLGRRVARERRNPSGERHSAGEERCASSRSRESRQSAQPFGSGIGFCQSVASGRGRAIYARHRTAGLLLAPP